ncbi:energy-coupling factor transporter transmembrane component T family protein [Flavonifractor hominis]|uniref:Energy-coupling factor transporter transmembrane component T n=1 Tax=Flavonifractor hominis TaxID=3133178 RepID=A0ABV1ERQ6_9FIRM
MKSLNPSCKLIGLLIPTLLLAALHHPLVNLVVFAVCLAVMLVSRVNGKLLAGAMVPVLLTALGMYSTGYHFHADSGLPINTAAQQLGDGAVWNGLIFGSRVLAFAGLGLLFVLTTDRIKLIRSLQQQLRLPPVFAYGLLAAWGMVPQMIREYRRTRAAFAARGIRVFPVAPALLKPLLVKSVRWSEELAIAMESKGFDGGRDRTRYDPMCLRAVDIAFPIVTSGLFLALYLLFR